MGMKLVFQHLGSRNSMFLKKIFACCFSDDKILGQASRIGKGISAQALHKTVRALLNAYGFCHSVCEES
jgi:hypothetical protein